jgi:GntR family transcriptional regulator/MocR family aminotransferase
MRAWKLAVEVRGDIDLPMFLRIARAIADDVRRGRLSAGEALPGTRALAESLGVHRNTVLAAYRELAAEGWVSTSPARGTFVAAEVPEVRPRRFAAAAAPRAAVPARVGFDLPPPATAPAPLSAAGSGVLSMSGGIPDVRLVPTAPLARALRRALRAPGRALLGYGDPAGPMALRAALAAMLSTTRGLAAGPDNVLVTRGSQMALDLAARALLAPGDVVAVEALGYRPAWEVFRAAGARLVAVPLDRDGARVEALAALARRDPIRAFYVTPHHQYPTTVGLAPGRRVALLDLARRARFAVLEDDYDHEFHYDGRPVLPLASADTAGVVVYIGTLSKVLAPGLRIGYAVAPVPVIARMVARRHLVDRQGDHLLEQAVAELLEDGEIQRHVRRARRIYAARRDVLVSLLRRTFGSLLFFRAPSGGTAIWARVAPEVNVEAWSARALEQGVLLATARHFAFDGRARPYVRLGFAQLDEGEMQDAVRRIGLALAM